MHAETDTSDSPSEGAVRLYSKTVNTATGTAYGTLQLYHDGQWGWVSAAWH